MFANDTLGCCVIAARAHQTLRFERNETGTYPKITDAQVKAEYFRQTGGADSGLVILDSLKLWRRDGWKAGNQKLRIKLFAQVRNFDKDSVASSIYSDVGVQAGVSLPLSAQDQLDNGQPWEVSSGPRARANSWGGHAIYLTAYNETYITCVTWGRKQRMTWGFFLRYSDECYATFDEVNSGRSTVIDHAAVASAVNSLSGG